MKKTIMFSNIIIYLFTFTLFSSCADLGRHNTLDGETTEYIFVSPDQEMDEVVDNDIIEVNDNAVEVDNPVEIDESIDVDEDEIIDNDITEPEDLNNTLLTGEKLLAGEFLESANGLYRLYLQATDGNLVLRDNETHEALWASGTNGTYATVLVLQDDGNLVMYTDENQAVWDTSTVNSDADKLMLRDSGALILFAGNNVVWSVNNNEEIDYCPDDPDKTKPGLCGCGVPEGTCEGPPENGNFSELVYPGDDGYLIYQPDENGNIIPDFSYVGYKNGEQKIPAVPVVKTINPVTGDNRTHIQNALDEIASMNLNNGIRGALLLKKGTYHVEGTININASGIVIRGEGNGDSDTKVIATKRTKHDLFVFDGSGNPNEDTNSKVTILGSYIPIGARTFAVASHNFNVGDNVFLTREPKQSWIALIGMDNLENESDPDDFSWTPETYTMRYKRVIKKIDGNNITIDAPLVDPIDGNYATGYLSKYTWSGKIINVGIENIRLESEYSSDDDESHGWNAIVMNRVQDGWVTDVAAYYFGYSTVNVKSHGYRISVLNCKNMYPKSITTGGRKYSFAVNGQLVLFKNCFSHSGRHDFVGHARTPGPNAYVNCTAQNQQSDIGPHHRWSTGMLFDNIFGDGAMNVQNRMHSGSGHGWAGAQTMFWNSNVNHIVIQNPPSHINWAIGNKVNTITNNGYWGTFELGYTESTNEYVWPQSLYEQQLKERLNRL